MYVRGRLKFRVGQIVYVAFSLDQSVMGFAFPTEERAALVASEPHKFHMPSASELRFNWVDAELSALEPTEARELAQIFRALVASGHCRLGCRCSGRFRWPGMTRARVSFRVDAGSTGRVRAGRRGRMWWLVGCWEGE